MFDFSMSEIALLVVVALVFIGPKDLPVAMRALSRAIKAMRRMAGEFQQHLDDMVKEADLSEARDELNKLRRFSVRDKISKTLDPERILANQGGQDAASPVVTKQDIHDREGQYRRSTPLPEALSKQELSDAVLPESSSAHYGPSSSITEDDRTMPYNARLAQRAAALERAPAILPPTSALRLIEESAHCHRPACLPPEIALHYGKRVLIVREEEEHGDA